MDFYDSLTQIKLVLVNDLVTSQSLEPSLLRIKINKIIDELDKADSHTDLLKSYTKLMNSTLDIDYDDSATINKLTKSFTAQDRELLAIARDQYVELAYQLNAVEVDKFTAISRVFDEVPKVAVVSENTKKVSKWTVDNFRRFANRQGIRQALDDAATEAGKVAGTDTYEISSHIGARPKCYHDQGKWYTETGKHHIVQGVIIYAKSELSIGEPDGLFGFNCTHVRFPVVEGVTPKGAYENIPEEANFTIYEDRQTQKKLERQVREQQTKLVAAREFGDDKQKQIAQAKVTASRKKLNSFVKERDYLTKNYQNTVPYKLN